MLKKKQIACSFADPAGDKSHGDGGRHALRERVKSDTVDACALQTVTLLERGWTSRVKVSTVDLGFLRCAFLATALVSSRNRKSISV